MMARLNIPPPAPSLTSCQGLWQHMKTLSNMIEERVGERERATERLVRRYCYCFLLCSTQAKCCVYAACRHCVYYVIDTILSDPDAASFYVH